MTLIPYDFTQKESERPKGFLRLKLPGQGPDDHLAVVLKDSHCINLDCDCGVSWLSVGELEANSADPWDAQGKALQVGVRLESGELEPANEEEGMLGLQIRQALKGRLTPKLLGSLRDRREQTREWGKDNGWRHKDWRDMEPGARVGWHEIFPAAKAILAHDGETNYFLDDQYCCTFGCPCTDIVIALVEMSSGAGVVGYLSYDFFSDNSLVLERQGYSASKLLHLLQLFFQQTPTLKAELRKRASFVTGEFAHLLRQQRLSAGLEATARSSVKVGRNDPCPCGSGKKYKKCCLA